MSEWGLYVGFKGGYDIRSHENGSLVLHIGDALEAGRQIVREHNCMAKMVGLVREYRHNGGGEMLSDEWDAVKARIDAALARAEGQSQ